ncbi:unnamed protein product [Rotaria magnacalcarata]
MITFTTESLQKYDTVYLGGQHAFERALIENYTCQLISRASSWQKFVDGLNLGAFNSNLTDTKVEWRKRLAMAFIKYKLVEFDLCIGSSSVSIPSSAREFDIWMWDQYPRLLSSFMYLWSNHKTLIKSCGSNCSQCIVIDGHQKCRRRVCRAKNVQVSTEEFESLTVGCCRTPSLGSRFCELHQVLDEKNVTAESLTKQKPNKKQKMMKKIIMGRYRQHGFGATNCRTIKQRSESYIKRCSRSFGILAGVTNCKIVITFSEIFRSETLREIISLLCSTIRASNYNFPKCGVYDDGCHLVEFIRNHYGQDLKRTSASTSLYETKFSVDRTHFKGHVGRWCRANMNPYKNEMLNGINTQAAEQLFSWVKNYANILSSLGWRRMPIYLLLLFHYKNLERMSIRPTHVFNIASSVPFTPTVSLAHAADTEQVSKYKEQQKQKKTFPLTTEETSCTKLETEIGVKQQVSKQKQSKKKTFKVADMNSIQNLVKKMEELVNKEEKKEIRQRNRKERKNQARINNQQQ